MQKISAQVQPIACTIDLNLLAAVWILRKHNERLSNTVTMLCWTRHAYHSIGVYGNLRNITDDAEYQEHTLEVCIVLSKLLKALLQGLNLEAFVDLILADATASNTPWTVSMQLSALDILQSLEESGPIDQGKCSVAVAD